MEIICWYCEIDKTCKFIKERKDNNDRFAKCDTLILIYE